jgi:twitching motility protein PilJ
MALKLFGKGDTDSIDQVSEDIIDFAADEIGEEIIPAETGGGGETGAGFGGFFSKLINLQALLVTTAIAGMGAAWLYVQTTSDAARDTSYIEKSSKLLMLSQRVAKDARESVQGQQIAFKTLKESRDTFDSIVKVLQHGDSVTGLSASPQSVRPVLNELLEQWGAKKDGVRTQINQILTQENTLFALRDHVLAINQLAPLLLSISDETVEIGAKTGMKQNDLYLAARQGMLSQRIAKDVNLFAQGGNEAAVAAAQFGKDAKLFKDTEARLRRVSTVAVKNKLKEANEVFTEMNLHVEGILSNAAELFVSQRASKLVVDKSDILLEKVRALVDSYAGLAEERAGLEFLLYILAAVLMASIMGIGWRFVQDEKDRAEVTAEQNRTTQDAILKLLDEMGNLADGDLTVEPEVTEQITGAIADSINFAVKEMRNLVTRIKAAAQQVALASESSRQTATELTEAALRQAAQITETSDRMNNMARSMEDMSQSAEKSAEVAQGSVTTAKRGAEAVQDTITGMDQMREQIQETAKRINLHNKSVKSWN